MEVGLIQKLNEAPGFENACIVKCFDAFYFRSHICATFELLGQNLFEFSRARRFRPLETKQLKGLAKGILTALAFMHNQRIVHCDVKPENVLVVGTTGTDVRLIDFGSSCQIGEQRYEYIQSRFYRAPEVMLGIAYGPPMDIWSVGCILAELMTGGPLFPGDDEAEQMQLFTQILGPTPDNVIAVSRRRKHFFTAEGKPLPHPKGDKQTKVAGNSLHTRTLTKDSLLLDLFGKCLQWDQDQRISAEDALLHPWFQKGDISTVRTPRQALTRRSGNSLPKKL
jgi:dual specificity tyrosine-phosphorylation-regulated kinase 2/3/4